MLLKGAFLLLILTAISWTSADYSKKERIKQHKLWLEKRNQMKPNTTDASHRIFYIRKWSKMRSEDADNEVNQIGVEEPKYEIVKKYYEEQELHNNTIIDLSTSTVTTTPSTTVIATSPATTSVAPMQSTEASTTLQTTLATTKSESGERTLTEVLKTSPMPKVNNATRTSKRRRPKHSFFSPWSQWSDCSRSCGGGVSQQTRECISRFSMSNNFRANTNRTANDCIGLHKRYRLCNEQSCPNADHDFREEQCTHFNSQIFRGQQYTWEAYIKIDAECELNCKPVGMNYFATLNDTVIDGTPCLYPGGNERRAHTDRAICVDGICKIIHSTGAIAGAYMNNGAVRCGSLLCRQMSGTFSKTGLPKGYVQIATIPASASNISITEMKNSMSLLVLKSADNKFIINGDYKVSLSGVYEAAGAIFEYHRIENNGSFSNKRGEGVTEWITCTGPTTEPIQLMVLNNENQPGVKYEYLLPITSGTSQSEEDYATSAETEAPIQSTISGTKHTLKSGIVSVPPTTTTRAPEKRRRKFMWKVIGFNPCSKSCGGGLQSPIIRCVREAPTRIFSSKRCAHMTKPHLSESQMKCNTQPCPAYWKIGEWTECNCNGPDEEEQQHKTREVKCVQESGTGYVIQVNSGACLEETPPNRHKCDCPKHLKRPAMEIHRNKGTPNHKPRGHRVHQSLLTNSTSKHVQYQNSKNSGVWLSADWNEQCSTECGEGIQYRSIFCDRSPPNTDRCDLRFTPDTTRQCASSRKCSVGEWFIGPWSECSGDCFNLTKSRKIFCVKDDEMVSDDECKAVEKPQTMQNCKVEEVADCKPKWYTSDWTDCTKKCGEGTQRRTVKCFEPNPNDAQLREANSCKFAQRPPALQKCNTESCEKPEEPRVDIVQNDEMSNCKDDFPNCHLVIKARLCSYEYYREHCCQSCQEISDETY